MATSLRAVTRPGITIRAVFLLGACSTQELADGLPTDTLSCHSCHGSEENNAPPWAPGGPSGTGARGVGAHQSHMREGALRYAVSCAECHIVPEVIDADGHVDPLPAEVTFGTLAARGALEPIWDTELLTCSETYCHGATLSGGTITSPVWTTLDGSQVTCDACHGSPPPEPHPQAEDCQRCHPDTMSTDEEINVLGGKHIDGVVDFVTDTAALAETPVGSRHAYLTESHP